MTGQTREPLTEAEVENALACIRVAHELGGHCPDDDAMDLARRILEGRTTAADAQEEVRRLTADLVIEDQLRRRGYAVRAFGASDGVVVTDVMRSDSYEFVCHRIDLEKFTRRIDVWELPSNTATER